MSSAYLEDCPTPWKTDLSRLCDGECGWRALQCIAPLMLLRLTAFQNADDRLFSEDTRLKLRESGDVDALVDGLLATAEAAPLQEEDVLFLKELALSLPSKVEQWANDHASLRPESTGASESDNVDDKMDRASVEAICELLRFTESLPLEDSECLEDVMRACLAQSGKTAGLFSTPESVSALIARLVEDDLQSASSLYDPCAGVGHLLAACAAKRGDTGSGIDVFAQDVDPEAYSLLRMRSIAASIASGAARPIDAKLGDVLVGPWHSGEAPFDVVVSHAPTLLAWPGSSSEILAADERFARAGALAPKDAADLAFVMHAHHCLAEGGVAALVVYPAPLRRGDAERTIRRHLLEVDAIDAVIQLPPKLFADSSMASSVLVLRKGRGNEEVLFVDAADRCKHVEDKNLLTRESIDQIAQVFETREEIAGFARNVPKGEIARNGWSLTVADYFQDKTPKISVDLDALKRRMSEVSDPAVFSKRIVNGLIR